MGSGKVGILTTKCSISASTLRISHTMRFRNGFDFLITLCFVLCPTVPVNVGWPFAPLCYHAFSVQIDALLLLV